MRPSAKRSLSQIHPELFTARYSTPQTMKPSPKSSFSYISPGIFPNSITVIVDRIIIHDRVIPKGDESKMMNVVLSVDLLLRDVQGTRMLASLKTDEVKQKFLWLIRERASYEISGFIVWDGGYSVHQLYNLEIITSSIISESDCMLKSIFFNPKLVSDISWNLLDDTDLFDVCGYVKYISNVRVCKFVGFMERELIILMETCLKWTPWVKDHVVVFLRGSWVDSIKERFDAFGHEAMPFVVIQNVLSDFPDEMGCPTVMSFRDASRVLFDPCAEEVQLLKQRLHGM